MAKRKHGQPDKFQRDVAPVDATPATHDAVGRALQRFATMFVVASKRERVVAMLLHRDKAKRNEMIQSAYKWVDPSLQTELDGNTGFPQHLKERFGELRGVLVDDAEARHTTLPAAAVLAANGFGAIFVADTKPLAILFPEIGPPTLCAA